MVSEELIKSKIIRKKLKKPILITNIYLVNNRLISTNEKMAINFTLRY